MSNCLLSDRFVLFAAAGVTAMHQSDTVIKFL